MTGTKIDKCRNLIDTQYKTDFPKYLKHIIIKELMS